MFIPYLGGIILLIIDGVTKVLANSLLPFKSTVETFLPFLDWYRTHNTGFHWIIGKINNHILWASTGLIVVLFLLFMISRSLLKERDIRFNRIFYSIIICLIIGAMGNVLEIIVFGRATDFFVFHPFPWPSNISDQYINAIIYIMMPVIVVKSIMEWIHSKKTADSGE